MTSSDLVLVGSYDQRLVALSVLISILAAYAAHNVAERVTVARGGTRLSWLIGGSTASGIGTWSTGSHGDEVPVRLAEGRHRHRPGACHGTLSHPPGDFDQRRTARKRNSSERTTGQRGRRSNLRSPW